MFSHALKSSIAAAALAAAMSSVPAIAQERTYDFALPAQDLQTSLKAFARVSGQQISFDGSAVRGKRAPALKGSFTVRDGVARLLAGSGLEASRGRSGILVIRPAATPAR